MMELKRVLASRGSSLLLLLILLGLAGAVARRAPADSTSVLVLTDGSRLRVEGTPAPTQARLLHVRLAPSGTLTSVPSARVDWKATAEANRQTGTPTPAAAAPPAARPGQGVSGLARGLTVDGDKAVDASSSEGKLKTASGKTLEVRPKDSYFGASSVAKLVTIEQFVADFSGCPDARAELAASVKNTSDKKLSQLRAYILLGGLTSRVKREQVHSLVPSELAPGDKAGLTIQVSCDFARSAERMIALIGDVGGVAEERAHPPLSAGREPGRAGATPAPATPPGKPRR